MKLFSFRFSICIFLGDSGVVAATGGRVSSSGHGTIRPSPSQDRLNMGSRPSTLPMPSPSSSSSQPIPVPTQMKAYEQIQRSNRQSPSSPSVNKVISGRYGAESPNSITVSV